MSERKLISHLRMAAPAPHDETEEYRRFNSVASWLLFLGALALTYTFCYMDLAASLWGEVSGFLPILHDRAVFLRALDPMSHVAYSNTVLASLLVIPLFLTIFSIGYWRTVVILDGHKSVSGLTAILVGVSFLISIFLLFIVFIHRPENYSERTPGFVQVFFWPYFPALGAGTAFLIANFLFSSLVGVAKLVLLRG